MTPMMPNFFRIAPPPKKIMKSNMKPNMIRVTMSEDENPDCVLHDWLDVMIADHGDDYYEDQGEYETTQKRSQYPMAFRSLLFDHDIRMHTRI